MKVKATISVEFEMNEGQPENAAEAALARGVGELQNAIQRGLGIAPTGVKSGSVRAKVTK